MTLTIDPRRYGHEGGNSLAVTERGYRPWYFGESARGGARNKRKPHKRTYRDKWAPRRPAPAGCEGVEAEPCADCGSEGGEPGDAWVRNGWRRYNGGPFGVAGVLCDGCRGERLTGPPVDPEEIARNTAEVLAERIGPPERLDPPPFRAAPSPRPAPAVPRWSDLADADAARRIADAFLGRADWDLFGDRVLPPRGGKDGPLDV